MFLSSAFDCNTVIGNVCDRVSKKEKLKDTKATTTRTCMNEEDFNSISASAGDMENSCIEFEVYKFITEIEPRLGHIHVTSGGYTPVLKYSSCSRRNRQVYLICTTYEQN